MIGTVVAVPDIGRGGASTTGRVTVRCGGTRVVASGARSGVGVIAGVDVAPGVIKATGASVAETEVGITVLVTFPGGKESPGTGGGVGAGEVVDSEGTFAAGEAGLDTSRVRATVAAGMGPAVEGIAVCAVLPLGAAVASVASLVQAVRTKIVNSCPNPIDTRRNALPSLRVGFLITILLFF